MSGIEYGSLAEDMEKLYREAVEQGKIEAPKTKRLSLEEEIEKILYVEIPKVIEKATEQAERGQWDDKYFKSYLPDYWYTAVRTAYGLSTEAKKYWEFHDRINEKTRPYRRKPWTELDRNFMEIVKETIEEEMGRWLWPPPHYEIPVINKEFEIAGDIMREMKEECIGEKYTMYR